MKNLAFALALIAGYTIANESKIDDTVVHVSEEDRVMNQAIAQAKNTLDQFLSIYRSPPEGAENFKLKVMLSDESGHGIHQPLRIEHHQAWIHLREPP